MANKKTKKSAKKPSKLKPKAQPSKSKPKKAIKTRPASRPNKKKEIVSESAIQALIEKGRHRGFITQVEVLNAFPEIEKDISGLEALYERLESANINIIESGRVFE